MDVAGVLLSRKIVTIGLFDEEAEQVKQNFVEEQKEEEETTEAGMHDRPALAHLEEETKKKAVSFAEVVEVEDEQPRTPPGDEGRSFFDARPGGSSAAAAAAQVLVPMSIFDATTRSHAEEAGERESKRARTVPAKKQRVERVGEEYERAVRAVKALSEEELDTIHDCEHDL